MTAQGAANEQIDMPDHNSDFAYALKGMLTEIEYGRAHYRIHSDLREALLNKTAILAPYSDFLDITVFAHFCGMILAVSHLLDRDQRTRSIYWLIDHVENHPTDFAMGVNVQDLRARLEMLSTQKERIRRIRNKRIAHTERMTAIESERFWASVELTGEDVQRLLSELRSIIMEVIDAHREHDWRWVMIAIDEETSELIDALMPVQHDQ